MILSVIGARPQFIKAAVVSRAFAAEGVRESIVHTGQHYDDAMSGRFLRELGISNVIANLGCGSGTHAIQTAQMMVGIENLMAERSSSINAVLVYGDTNSSIAAALVAAKLVIPVIHVEAGLRSFNRSMPEEVNRVLIDHLSELLLCSSEQGVRQLAREGINNPVVNVGDVMLDAFQLFMPLARVAARPAFIDGPPFTLVTIHRPSNTDDPCRLRAIVDALAASGERCIWPIHPRLGDRLRSFDLPSRMELTTPLSYLEILACLEACRCVITDSGGLQKEAHWAQRPCITVREETEWLETLEGGWNRLWDPSVQPLSPHPPSSPTMPWRLLYGDGEAAQRIARLVKGQFVN